MDTPAPVPAQAEVAQPAPISAVDHAVLEQDMSKFREAKQAERSGKPLADVAPEPAKVEIDAKPVEKPAEAPAPPADRTLSRRQQQINDYERRIAEQDQRIRALEAGTKTPSAPAPTKEAEYKRFMAMPDAPKLDQFESIEEFNFAANLFVNKTLLAERDATQQADAQRAHRHQAAQQKFTDYGTRCDEFRKTDPDFHTRLSDDVKALRPFDDLREGEQPTASHAIAEEILRSPYGPQLALHLSDHPEDLDRLHTLTPYELNLEFGMFRGQFRQTSQPPVAAPPQPKTVSTAPHPPTVLGTKATEPVNSIDAAVASDDMVAFKAARLRERTANLR